MRKISAQSHPLCSLPKVFNRILTLSNVLTTLAQLQYFYKPNCKIFEVFSVPQSFQPRFGAETHDHAPKNQNFQKK